MDIIKPSVFCEKTRKARKQHTCCECGCDIKKGSEYNYISGIWDGCPDNYKQCFNCYDIFKMVIDNHGTWLDPPWYGGLKEWFFEQDNGNISAARFLEVMSNDLKIHKKYLEKLLSSELV